MPSNLPLYQAQGLRCVFGSGRRAITALDGVDFTITSGEVLGIVGESGAGKSTLAKILLGLQRPTVGSLLFREKPMPPTREICHQVQAVFQNPLACFNHFFTVKTQLRDTFHLMPNPPSPSEMDALIDQALETVHLSPTKLDGKYPFELSGGQIQRLLLARIALIRPQVLIADEPTSMVDACSRTHILDLVMSLQHEFNMTVVFITHDLGLAHYLCDRILVMHQGKMVEDAPTLKLFNEPEHPYTQQLLSNIPRLHSAWIRSPNSPFSHQP